MDLRYIQLCKSKLDCGELRGIGRYVRIFRRRDSRTSGSRKHGLMRIPSLQRILVYNLEDFRCMWTSKSTQLDHSLLYTDCSDHMEMDSMDLKEVLVYLNRKAKKYSNFLYEYYRLFSLFDIPCSTII